MVGHRYRQTNDGFTELEGDMRGERWSSADRSQVGRDGGADGDGCGVRCEHVQPVVVVDDMTTVRLNRETCCVLL